MNAVATVASLPARIAREKLFEFEQALQALPADCQLKFENLHDFADGVYARSLYLPAGTLCTGKIHKSRHFFVVMQGRCTVVDSNGVRKEIVAPYLGVTEPGVKRAVHVHEDMIWTSFHRTDSKNPEDIEREITTNSFEEFEVTP